eukprot:Em0013g505a
MPANRLHFSPAGAISRTVVSSVVSRPKGKDAPRPSLAGPGREYPPGYPNIIYPNQGTWLWNKADPKSSLKAAPAPPVAGQPATVDQSHSAAAWILNLIEITHWVSFPIGFLVTFILFDKALVIAPHVDNSNLRVFCLLLGLLSQVYGGGISGNMMHKYEGWQVAPFRNPLDSGTHAEIPRVRFQQCLAALSGIRDAICIPDLGSHPVQPGRVRFPEMECCSGSSIALYCFRGTKGAKGVPDQPILQKRTAPASSYPCGLRGHGHCEYNCICGAV